MGGVWNLIDFLGTFGSSQKCHHFMTNIDIVNSLSSSQSSSIDTILGHPALPIGGEGSCGIIALAKQSTKYRDQYFKSGHPELDSGSVRESFLRCKNLKQRFIQQAFHTIIASLRS
jgi:hypothetical protein